jgi:cystathionine beta-lyase
VTCDKPEGTYLLWLDFTALGLDDKALDDLIINKAGLWLDSGKMFGKAGSGYQRINAACPSIVLEVALERIKKAL